MPRLSNTERERAIGMIMSGTSKAEVALQFRCSRVTIYELWQRYHQTGSTGARPRTGQPRITTAAEDRHIRVMHLRNRHQTATSTSRTFLAGRVSLQTVRNRLRAYNLRARRPYIGPVLTAHHKAARLHWCRNHLNWNQIRWNQVVFSDESRFSLSKADGRLRVWRRTGEHYAD